MRVLATIDKHHPRLIGFLAVPAAKDPTVLMNVVAPDEPEGYRGRRRRFLFPFTQKAGGAALPALLVAASIVVVLIVVGVSQLLPKQAAEQIPIDGNNGQVSNSASTGSGSGPLLSVGPSSPGPAVPPTFNTLSLEAESAMGGAAASSSCSGCSGKKVSFIGHDTGWVSFGGINVTAAVEVNVTVYYICACTPGRTLFISVNGSATVTVAPGTTGDWNTTKPVTVKVTLPAGVDTIKLYNPTTSAPDLDRVVISRA